MLQRYIKYTTHGFPKYIFLMQSLVIYLKYVYVLYCNKAWAKSPHIIEEQKKWQHFKRAVTAEASHAFGQPRILWAAKCVQSSNINILGKCCLSQFGSVLGIEPGPPGWESGVLATGPYHSHYKTPNLPCSWIHLYLFPLYTFLKTAAIVTYHLVCADQNSYSNSCLGFTAVGRALLTMLNFLMNHQIPWTQLLLALSWIDDYWLRKCLTAESLERLIPILGVIGSILKIASMKTKKVTLATGFLQSLLARVWFVFWFQTSTKQTYESILMWLFLILEIWWWRTWLFCFCWLWESKVLNLTKMLSMQAQRLNYCNSTRHCQSLLRSRTKYFT